MVQSQENKQGGNHEVLYSQSNVIVRYAETDRMGIVHHSVFPIWYELARTEFIKLTGMTYSKMEASGVMTPLVDLTCHYIRPAEYEDELVIKVWVGKLTPARIEFNYEVYHDQILINTGSTVHAWVGKDLKPLNLKKNLPDIYEKIQKAL